jgi:hypothetical protein
LRRSHVLIVAAVAVLSLAACGGSSAKASGSTATSTTTPGGRGFLTGAFLTCLKDHGYTPPAGFGTRRARGASGASGATGTGRRRGFFGGGGGLASNPKAQAAFQACRSQLPNGGRFGAGFGGGRANATAVRAYLSCLSDNGVKVPKISTSTPSSTRRGVLAQVRQDPKFATADPICRKLLTFGGSTTTTTP